MRRVRVLAVAVGLAQAWAPAGRMCAQDAPAPSDASLPVLVKSPETRQHPVPLVVYEATKQRAVCVNMTLKWEPLEAAEAEEDNALKFQFVGGADAAALPALRPQLWISSLASALAWGEPWREARFTVNIRPTDDGADLGAALAVAMISVASGVKHPADVVVLGGLNPDNSLRAVEGLKARLEAASAVGIKRVVMPRSQRAEEGREGMLSSAEQQARDLNLEPVLVDDLKEAVHAALPARLPAEPVLQSVPRAPQAVFRLLERRCQLEIAAMDRDKGNWPDGEALTKLPPHLQRLWTETRRLVEAGVDAFRGGQMFTAWHYLMEAAAGVAAAEEFALSGGASFDFRSYDEKANQLRGEINKQTTKVPFDRGELESAMMVAEMMDWMAGVAADVEGPQTIARQAFGPRSDATPEFKDAAKLRLFSGYGASARKLKFAGWHGEVWKALGRVPEMPVFDRAAVWLRQLLPTHLAKAEFFSAGVKDRTNELADSLLADSRIASFAAVLKRKKEEWDQVVAADEAKNKPPEPASKVAFVPGDAYTPPKPPVPPPPPSSLSDPARCLMWVNDYCDVALLDQMYLKLSGARDPATGQWLNKDGGGLQTLLQSAEVGARRGIAAAGAVGVSTATLALIYERATSLRGSRDDGDRLEALRQYWRCGLLGNMAWQLGYIARAAPMAPVVPPTPAPPPEEAPADSAPPAPDNADTAAEPAPAPETEAPRAEPVEAPAPPPPDEQEIPRAVPVNPLPAPPGRP